MLRARWQEQRNTVHHTDKSSSLVGRKDLERGKKQLCLLKLQQIINHYSAEFPVQKEAGALGSCGAKFGLNPSQI
jgi:hypothetical protein